MEAREKEKAECREREGQVEFLLGRLFALFCHHQKSIQKPCGCILH